MHMHWLAEAKKLWIKRMQRAGGSSVLWEAVLDLAPWTPFWQLVSLQVLFCPSVTPPASTPRGSWLPWAPLQL